MSELLLDPFLEPARLAGLHDPQGWECMQHEMARQAAHPPSDDRKLSALWHAMPEVLAEQPELGEFVAQWATLQSPGVPISERVGKLGAVARLDCLPPGRRFFGQRFSSSNAWRRALSGISSDPDRLMRFATALSILPVNTTTDQRYGPLEAMRQAQFGADRPKVDIWEGGCSVRIGANWLLMKDKISLPKTRIVRPSGRVSADGSAEFITDVPADAAYQELLGGASLRGDVVCADAWPYREEQIRRLARAALRPQELSDREFMHRFYRLRDAQLRRVHFEHADITREDDMLAIRDRHADKRLKVGFLGTVLDQIGAEGIPKAIDLSMDMLDDDGTLFIMDFGYVDPADHRKFRLHSIWTDWTYGLFAIHKADPSRTVHELMRFRTSRCFEAQVGPGSLLINGQYVPMTDLLHTQQSNLQAA